MKSSSSTPNPIGQQIYQLAEKLYPICRSITGNGVRETLGIIQETIPLELHEVASGTQVLDWTVPKEWNIKDAYLLGPDGQKIVDWKSHALHVLNYSVPKQGSFSLEELRPHLFSLPERPEVIPYRTSYYQENWGFCMAHSQLESLVEGEYQVHIDSSLEDGSLTYGELYIPGKSEKEVLFSTHVCHPSLANDNLSGIGVCVQLAAHLLSQENEYSYRFLFLPGTIGAITWLALNREKTGNIAHGLVAALLGDMGSFTYKKSRRGHAEIDRVVAKVLTDSGEAHQIIDFFPYGYDERQYCSPGFNLAVGNLGRTPFGQFSEYHNSGDNLDFIHPAQLQTAFEVYKEVTFLLENNLTYNNLQPCGEPQLGKRGLYSVIGGANDQQKAQLAMLWVLNLSDGAHSLLDIAEQAELPFRLIREMADALLDSQLLEVHK